MVGKPPWSIAHAHRCHHPTRLSDLRDLLAKADAAAPPAIGWRELAALKSAEQNGSAARDGPFADVSAQAIPQTDAVIPYEGGMKSNPPDPRYPRRRRPFAAISSLTVGEFRDWLLVRCRHR